MLRKHLARLVVERITADHPLSYAVSIWGVTMGTLVLARQTPSYSLAQLPPWEAQAWGACAVASSILVLFGLYRRRSLAVARGTLLLALVVLIYAVSVVSTAGWSDGGVTATFMLVISVVIGREGVLLRRRVSPRSGGSRGRTE